MQPRRNSARRGKMGRKKPRCGDASRLLPCGGYQIWTQKRGHVSMAPKVGLWQASLFPCISRVSPVIPSACGRDEIYHLKAQPYCIRVVPACIAQRKELPNDSSLIDGCLAGVACSCVSFGPMGAWLLRNPPPQTTYSILLLLYSFYSFL